VDLIFYLCFYSVVWSNKNYYLFCTVSLFLFKFLSTMVLYKIVLSVLRDTTLLKILYGKKIHKPTSMLYFCSLCSVSEYSCHTAEQQEQNGTKVAAVQAIEDARKSFDHPNINHDLWTKLDTFLRFHAMF